MSAGQTIRLARVLTGSRANGPGKRDVYWTAGCSIRCPGCINPHYLEGGSGVDVGFGAIEALLARRRGSIEGITWSGGEPTDQPAAVAHLAAFARGLGLSVVVFTGRTLAECEAKVSIRPLLEACDVLVAGPFVVDERRRSLPLVGSVNQRVHFLSDRYSEEDLRGIPDAEILLGRGGIAVTGIGVMSRET